LICDNSYSAAISLVQEHDKTYTAFVDNVHNRHLDHFSRDRVEIVCEHAIRHKEATGKTLDDNKIDELVRGIYRREPTRQTAAQDQHQSKVLEAHYAQIRQIHETMKKRVSQQQHKGAWDGAVIWIVDTGSKSVIYAY